MNDVDVYGDGKPTRVAYAENDRAEVRERAGAVLVLLCRLSLLFIRRINSGDVDSFGQGSLSRSLLAESPFGQFMVSAS